MITTTKNTDKHTALIKEATPLVKYISHKVKRRIRMLDLECIECAAFTGAFHAARKYNPENNTPFLRFAKKHIYGAIIDWLRQEDPLTRHLRAEIKNGSRKVIVFHQIEHYSNTLQSNQDSDKLTWSDLRPQRNKLSPHDRVVLALYCLEGYTMKQIGEIFGASLLSVWRQIHNIKQTLKQDLPQ